MQHLKYVSYLDYFQGALAGLGAIAILALGVLQAVLSFMADAGMVSIIISLVIAIVVAAVMGAMALLAFTAGRQISQGRGRMLQTVLSALSLPSFPLGTAIGAYGLWVCWANQETVPVLSGEASLEE